MVKFMRKKKRLFDEDADWVPQNSEPSKMKTGAQPADTPTDTPADTPADPPADPPADTPAEDPTKGQRPTTDADGLDRAYTDQSNMHLDSQGTLYVSNTKGVLKAGVDRKLQDDWRPAQRTDDRLTF